MATVPSRIRLKDLARTLGMSYTEFKKFNPQFLQGVTAPDSNLNRVYIPYSLRSRFKRSKRQIARLRQSSKQLYASYSPSAKGSFHRVRRGENLYAIAKKYKTSVYKLKKLNGLKSHRILSGSRLRVAAGSARASSSTRYHVVKRGESLSRIARKYKMSLASLRVCERHETKHNSPRNETTC